MIATHNAGKFSGKKRPSVRKRGLVRNFFFVTIISIWSYWIFFCQPLENKYQVETTTTKISANASIASSKESWASKMEVETADISEDGTSAPTDDATSAPTYTTTGTDAGDTDAGEQEDGEQEDGNEGDDINFDEEESESDGDDDGESADQEDNADDDKSIRELDQEDSDSSPEDIGERQAVKIINSNSNVIPADERFKNHLYMFVHIGKAGGMTLQSNIRTICLRNYVEQNILRQRRGNKKKVQGTKCSRHLEKQADPSIHNPTTEMVISNDRVVGFLHMNYLTYWWNANDDGESEDRKRDKNIQDEISGIIDSGKAYSQDPAVFRNPPVSERKDDGMTKSTAFLVPIRDPIDRLVSAFNYQHPNNGKRNKNCDEYNLKRYTEWVTHSFYCECFDSVNDLVNIFLQDDDSYKQVAQFSNPNEKISCLKLADDIVMGKSHYKPTSDDQPNDSSRPGLEVYQQFDLDLIRKRKKLSVIGHITMNYGYYYRRAFLKYPEKDIVAIRTDHMWEDLQRLEYLLGGTALVQGEATGHVTVSHGSHKYVASEKITDPNQLQGMCCVILSEAKIYMELIERAINLSEEQKKESITAFQKRCNIELCSED